MAEFKPKAWMACPLCGKQSPMPDPDAREWVGLTDAEWESMYDKFAKYQEYGSHVNGWGDFARAIEAKLKEKNEM